MVGAATLALIVTLLAPLNETDEAAYAHSPANPMVMDHNAQGDSAAEAALPAHRAPATTDLPVAPTNNSRGPRLFVCDFETEADRNYDHWPDGWSRAAGPRFPSYIKVRIARDALDATNRCLQMELDGGGAIAYGPPIPIDALESLSLVGQAQTSGLERHRARYSLTLLDEKRQPLMTIDSPSVHDAAQWRPLAIGPIAPPAAARYAVVGLHLEPGDGGDLTGTASFDDIQLVRLVRIDLEVDRASHLYPVGTPITLRCRVSGFGDDTPRLAVTMCDVDDQELNRTELELAPLPASDGTAEDSVGTLAAEWRVPAELAGFYRLKTRLTGTSQSAHERQLTVVVYEPREVAGRSEFGWSFARGEQTLRLQELPQIVSTAGNGWLKFPVWFASDDQSRAAALAEMVDRCNAHHLTVVGLLNQPPPEVREALGGDDSNTAAGTFTADSKLWYPSLESVLTRLGLRIRWWQLGDDDDASFIGYADLPDQVLRIKRELDRIGQDVYVGFAWSWLEEPPPAQQMPWRFVSYGANPPLTPNELADNLEPLRRRSDRRWLTLAPPAEGLYDTVARATDLVRQMVAAKAHGAGAIFAADPLDPSNGLLQDGGTPGELFLPWRTTALELGGATYIGQADLPGGSHNEMFSRDGEAIMVVWNDQPTREQLYLGENVRQIDPWGRTLPVKNVGNEQVISVSPVPSFVGGVNEAIAHWRSTFYFENARLSSVIGQPHQNACMMRNHFPMSVNGRVQLKPPPGWSIQPARFEFKLAPGETLRQPLEILLPFDATSASQDVHAEVEIMADRRYRFHVLRRLEVGLGDLSLEALTRLNEAGQLEVEQRINNNTAGEVSFRCTLYAPGRRRANLDLERLGQGLDTRIYVLPDGQSLVGKALWIRAEEIGGDRVLNYRFEATP